MTSILDAWYDALSSGFWQSLAMCAVVGRTRGGHGLSDLGLPYSWTRPTKLVPISSHHGQTNVCLARDGDLQSNVACLSHRSLPPAIKNLSSK